MLNSIITDMKINDFGYNRVTNNVLDGLVNYIEDLLYPTYLPLKGETRTGKENEIEVRKYWTGKPRILPFIVVSTMGNGFKEDKKNFEPNDMLDEFIEEVNGQDIAFRKRGLIGNITISCTMATEDSDNRIKLSDYLLDKLMSKREAFLYRDGDDLSDSLISFTNSNYEVRNFKEVSAGSADTLTYLYFCEIDIELNVQYNWIEQVFPGVITAIDYDGTVLPPSPIPPIPPIPPSISSEIPTVESFIISSITNTVTLPNTPVPGTELVFWQKSVQVVVTNYNIVGNNIVFTFNLNIGDEVIIAYSYLG